MKRIKLLSILFGITVVFFFNRDSNAATIYVPDDFSTIQSAISSSNLGDKIIVRNGTYDGFRIEGKSDLRIEGDGSYPIIESKNFTYHSHSLE